VDASQGNGIGGRTPQPPGPIESDDLEDWLPKEVSAPRGDVAPPDLELELDAEPEPEPEFELEPEPEPELEPELEPEAESEEEAELELERVREDLQRMEEYAWACEERAERAERELAQMRERAASMKQAAARAAAVRYPASEGAEGEGEASNLNQISFEALRSLGLTVNQAARVISVRDQVGGFASADGVDAVPGLPGEIREKLKELGSA
jgi:DNA uptake protein ComE-like DNA-binding protein